MESEVFDGRTLKGHLRSCHERVANEGLDPEIGRFYKKAESLIRKSVPYLSVVDQGTTGLNTPKNWNALVEQAGAVSKPDNMPTGGSYGIGKNAVFNLSAIRTVMYSTRYVAGRKGRQEKIQGKSILMTHTPPQAKQKQDVQHVGFLKWPALKNLSELPSEFSIRRHRDGRVHTRFRPPTSREREWIDEMTKAVIENFFYAIHEKELVVDIVSQGRSERRDYARYHRNLYRASLWC